MLLFVKLESHTYKQLNALVTTAIQAAIILVICKMGNHGRFLTAIQDLRATDYFAPRDTNRRN